MLLLSMNQIPYELLTPTAIDAVVGEIRKWQSARGYLSGDAAVLMDFCKEHCDPEGVIGHVSVMFSAPRNSEMRYRQWVVYTILSRGWKPDHPISLIRRWLTCTPDSPDLPLVLGRLQDYRVCPDLPLQNCVRAILASSSEECAYYGAVYSSVDGVHRTIYYRHAFLYHVQDFLPPIRLSG